MRCRRNQRGKALVSRGVNFYDLTMIFAKNKDPLYKDFCCHLNAEGYRLIADKIGKSIIKNLSHDDSI